MVALIESRDGPLATRAVDARRVKRGVTHFSSTHSVCLSYYESADGQISFYPRAKRHESTGLPRPFARVWFLSARDLKIRRTDGSTTTDDDFTELEDGRSIDGQ